VSFACVIRLVPSYVNSIHRPFGEVIFRILPLPEPLPRTVD